MTPEQLAEFAGGHLRSILEMSGEVLYSDVGTLQPGRVYLLGHNPGGDSNNTKLPTVRSSLAELPKKTVNSYLDTTWSGRDTLQRRIIWLLKELGLSPREVAASNLIFARSRDAATSQFGTFAELCWPVHERILEMVRPRLILAYGNSSSSPFSFLMRKFAISGTEDFPSGHGNWMCRRFEVPGRFAVVGLPHLSRYDVTSHRSVIDWIAGTEARSQSNTTGEPAVAADEQRARHPSGRERFGGRIARRQPMTVVCPRCQSLLEFDGDLRIGTFAAACRPCGTSFVTLILTIVSKRSSYSEREGYRRFTVRVRDEEGAEAVFNFVNVGRADLELRSKDVAAFSFLGSDADDLREFALMENKTVNQYLKITRPFDLLQRVRDWWRK